MSNLNFDAEKSLDAAFDAEGGTTFRNKGMPDVPPPQQDPQKGLLQRYAELMNRGSPRGGMVGGVIGQAVAGYPGMVGGAFLGNLAGQAPDLTPEQQGLRPPGLARLTRKGGYTPPPGPAPYTPDYKAAAADAGTQAMTGGAMRWGAAPLAAKAGFPRLAAFLGATTPQKAVSNSTPAAVKGVSTSALQAVDAATLAGEPAAKEIAAISAEQARRDAVLAMERQTANKAMEPIQARMPGRVAPMAEKTQAFAQQLMEHVPMDKIDKAFADAPSVMEAASSEPVMAARQQMVRAAFPQSLDTKALKLAARPVAAAAARGVGPDAAQYAADAAGLRTLGGDMPMDNSFLSKLFAHKLGGAAPMVMPRGGMSPARVAQTTAATLGERGGSTINPLLEKLVSNNPAYRAAPTSQVLEDLLRRHGAK